MLREKIAKLSLVGILFFALAGAADSQGSQRQANPDRRPTAMTFRIIARGESRDDDGHQFASTAYRASDGSKLNVLRGRFESQRLAEEYLGKQTAKASKVIESGPETDKTGRAVGKRAQVAFSTGDSGTVAAVLWTNGAEYREIVSDSLPGVLALEKALAP
jgi:hypothetical protein